VLRMKGKAKTKNPTAKNVPAKKQVKGVAAKKAVKVSPKAEVKGSRKVKTASLKNLKPFKPGQCGNPKGRPKTIPEITILLSNKPEAEYKAVIDKLFFLAKKGNIKAIEVLLDRSYGKAKQDVNIRANVSLTDQPVIFE
jgi:hypothetical protein